MRNIRNKNDSNAMNLTNKIIFNEDSKFIDISHINVSMKKIFVDINSDSRAVKYKKTKLIKFNSVEVVEISKKFKKLTQIVKKQLSKLVFANCLIFFSNCSNRRFAALSTKK